MRARTVIAFAGLASIAAAQPPGHGPRHMAEAALFVATASGGEVVPSRATAATATAAIVVSRARRELRYDLTYHGLERGGPSRIALHNFGPGGTGPLVATLCGGAGADPCPTRPSGRIAGVAERLPLPDPLLLEFATGRIYVEITGGDGRPQIRGQLTTNGAMVPVANYVASLTAMPSQGARGEGTAVLSETYLSGGRVAVAYSVTVAGTSGTADGVSLAEATPAAAALAAPRTAVTGMRTLPGAVRAPTGRVRGGGTFSGRYVARRVEPSAVLAVKLLEQGRAPMIVVSTSRFPRGELVGEFVPVR